MKPGEMVENWLFYAVTVCLLQSGCFFRYKNCMKRPDPSDINGFRPFLAEMKGFEPLCRDEPTNAFRVRRVMATSLHLQI